MSLADQLAINVDPATREYIDAKIAEAVAPLREHLRIERQMHEALRQECADMCMDFRERLTAALNNNAQG